MFSIIKRLSLLILFFCLSENGLSQIQSDFASYEKPFAQRNVKSKSSSEKIAFIVGGGLGIHFGYEEQYKNGLTANLGIIPYSDGYRGLRIDAGYLKLIHKDNILREVGETYENKELRTGGDWTMYNLRLDLIIGYLKQKSIFNAYGFMGLGIGINHISEMKYTRLISNKDTSFSYGNTFESHDEIYGKMGLGAGLSIGLSKKFRLYTELQYDFWSFGWPLGEGEIISRAGIMLAVF